MRFSASLLYKIPSLASVQVPLRSHCCNPCCKSRGGRLPIADATKQCRGCTRETKSHVLRPAPRQILQECNTAGPSLHREPAHIVKNITSVSHLKQWHILNPPCWLPCCRYRGLAMSVTNMGILTGLQFPLTGAVTKVLIVTRAPLPLHTTCEPSDDTERCNLVWGFVVAGLVCSFVLFRSSLVGRSGNCQVQSRLPLALLVARSLAWRVPRWSLSWCSNSASVDRMSQHPPMSAWRGMPVSTSKFLTRALSLAPGQSARHCSPHRFNLRCRRQRSHAWSHHFLWP